MSRTWALPLCLLVLACGKQETTGLNGADSGPVIMDHEHTSSDAFSADDALVTHEDAGDPPIGGDDAPIDTGVMSDASAAPDATSLPLNPDAMPVSPDASTTPTDAGMTCMMDRDCGRGGGFSVFCDPMTSQCVECLSDMNCRRGQTCDLTAHQCVTPCFMGGRCVPGQTCEPVSNTCVDCIDDMGCDSDEVCDTSTNECVGCRSDADCTNVGQNICDTTASECVACASDNDCSRGICDTNIPACVTSSIGRGLCEACDDDAQCGGNGNLCIGTISGAGFIDRTCALDCSMASCPGGFDCISVRNGSAQQCRPRYPMQNPTCTAYNHVGTACPFSATEPDPGCGIQNRQDALCILSPTTMSGVCTIGCDDGTDCPVGFNCTGASAGQTGVCLP